MPSLKEHAEKLDSGNEAERIYAAEDIGYLNTSDGVPALLERLGQEPSRAVRDSIFHALSRIDHDAVIEGSVALLASEHPQIRNQAVELLRRKGAASVPFLRRAMRESGKDIRKLVLDVLIGFQTTGVEEIYAAALTDDDINVIITAVENLGKTGAKRFRVEVEELLLAPASHPMLIVACLEALSGMGNDLSLGVIHRRLPDLAKLPDLFLISWLKAMGALGTAREFVEIASLFAARAAHYRAAILEALLAIHRRHPAQVHGDILLPAVQAVAENGDPPLARYQAVRALGFLASRDDVYSFLLVCLSSPERMVRLGAIESLRLAERSDLDRLFASRATEETDEDVLQALRC